MISPPTTTTTTTATSASSAAPTLLLVEDNDIDAEFVLRLVRRLGLELRVVRARNGEDALGLLCPEEEGAEPVRPAVIVLDINMPKMNGFELLERIAGTSSLAGIPAFMLSTSGTPRDRASARELRVRGYLVKPLRAPQLMEVLEAIAPTPTEPPSYAECAPVGQLTSTRLR